MGETVGFNDDDQSSTPPFSPSPFLDLPQTPPNEQDGGFARELDFISRTLMEDDFDGQVLCQRPARGRVQLLRFAQDLLSDDLPGGGNSAPPSASSSSDEGTSMTAAGALGFQQNPALFDDSGCLLFLGAAGLNIAADEPKQTAFTAGDDVFFSGLAAEGAIDMREMLNLAFIKGMEEARQFLPSNSPVSVPILHRENNQASVVAGIKKSANGRNRKSRQDADARQIYAFISHWLKLTTR